MLLLRLLGGWSLLVALVAFFNDLILSGRQDAFVTTSLGKHWFALSPTTLNLTQAGLERHVHPVLWDPVLTSLLVLPAALVFAVLGVVLYVLGRRRRTINIFAN